MTFIILKCRENLEIYSAELENLGIKIIELMANALAIDPEEITELFDIGTQSIRVNYYPPCPQPEKVIGIKSHSDAGGLTILLEINDIEGLQIKKEGQWIPVLPLPNAFIINIADILEVYIIYVIKIIHNFLSQISLCMSTNRSSTDKNVEIARSDAMTRFKPWFLHSACMSFQ
jgi:hypothetical protein